ncbi:serine dehydratase subunit alpha family protein [Sphaerochaeta sp. UBA5836]|uniref:L-cysteine desulfidase family protein n=1 Tax=Sphaerochaeta sp. UBA5836 TaxID=1947474 RepID=UPI0032E3BEAF
MKHELIPALGCTEPIAIALAAAKATEVLGTFPDSLHVACSGNIIKNVKSVTVPNSGGLCGIDVAATLGAVAGKAEKELEVLSEVTGPDQERTKALVDAHFCTVSLAEGVENLFISMQAKQADQSVLVEIHGSHTNITKIVKNGVILHNAAKGTSSESHIDSYKELLDIRPCIEFANEVQISDVQDIIERQIELNTAIAEEGLRGDYGIGVGKTMLKYYDDADVRVRACARAAAGSDARMGGCALPVVINSGSGNQGMTVSLPVIEYAREVNASHEKLIRALVLANLIALLQKRYIGNLSAFCGAVSAATGAASGIAYLYGGSYEEISNTITNTLANIGGIVCDGAKSSCAAKIASALDAAIFAFLLGVKEGRTFKSGDGLVKEDAERTIQSVGRMGREGMKSTDVEILNIMLEK